MSGQGIARKDVGCAQRPEIVLPEMVTGTRLLAWRDGARLCLESGPGCEMSTGPGTNASGNLVGSVKNLVKF